MYIDVCNGIMTSLQYVTERHTAYYVLLMCGNGARRVARGYAVEHGLLAGPRADPFSGHRRGASAPAASTGSAMRSVRRTPPSSTCAVLRRASPLPYVELGDPGLPHAVLEVPMEAFDDLDALRERGRRLRHSPAFPKGANVSFVCLTGESRVRAITFERGVEDFTLACGTGCGAITVSLSLAASRSLP